jgi:hypothetical protein
MPIGAPTIGNMFQTNPQMVTLSTEIRLFLSRIGSLRSVLPHLALLFVFGFMVPNIKGVDFLDSQILGAYACLGIIFAAPATAQAFPAGAGTSFPQARARIFVSVAYGEIVSITLLAAGIATVYLTNRGRYVPQPDWETLARCAIFGLGASAVLASLAALLTVRFSRSAAIIFLRVAFFGLLVLYFYRGQWLADVGLVGAGACLAVAGSLIALLKKACG